MKNTMDYIVGDTAIRIVNTGKKIKVINVRKEKIKKKLFRRLWVMMVTGSIMIFCCFSVVNLENTRVTLNQKVYDLRNEITQLEKENKALSKEIEDTDIDYDDIMEKAEELGMSFPKAGQLYRYKVKKSTAVKINSEE